MGAPFAWYSPASTSSSASRSRATGTPPSHFANTEVDTLEELRVLFGYPFEFRLHHSDLVLRAKNVGNCCIKLFVRDHPRGVSLAEPSHDIRAFVVERKLGMSMIAFYWDDHYCDAD